jgi:STE24 endopeptidase
LYHVHKLLAYLTLMALAGFWFTHWAVPKLLKRHGEQWGVRDIADPGSAPVIMAVLAMLGIPGGILFNSIIRFHENEADAFGLEAAREPDGFAMTAMQLSEYRKIEPGALEEVLFYDHPSGRTRVRMAMEWKAKHLGELPPEQRGIIVMTPDPKQP